MQIPSISCPQNTCNKHQLAFGNKITRALQSKSFVDDAMLDRMLSERDEIVGTLPKDFLGLFRKNNPLKLSYQDFIAKIREIFSEASGICENFENVKAANVPDVSKMSVEELFADFKKSIDELSGDTVTFSKVSTEEIQTEKKLEDVIRNGFIKIGLVSKNDKIKVTYVSEGRFSYVFKISGIDENGNPIFSDKALKHKKEPERNKKEFENGKRGAYRLIQAKADEMIDYLRGKTNLNSEFSLAMESFIKQVKGMTNENEFIQKLLQKFFPMHGFARECNMPLFLEKNLGNNPEIYMAKFHFADGKKYVITEFLPQDTKQPNAVSAEKIKGALAKFHTLGLAYEDAQPANFINGKLIDFGGFEVINPVLAKSDVARKYYKKVSNVSIRDKNRKHQEQIRRLNYYYQLAKNNKLSNAEEVILGLGEAKNMIPKSKQSELLF